MARLFDDAASDYLELGSTPVTGVPLTLAAWFNKDNETNTGTVLGIGNNTGGGTLEKFYIQYTSLEDIRARTQSLLTTGAALTSGNGLINSWTHGAGVFSASNSRTAYRDGANAVTDTVDVTPLTLNVILIGAEYGTAVRASFFSGHIAEAAIWNRALSAAEVAALAKGFSPLWMPNGLVFYCPLIRNLSNYKGTAPTATGTSVSNHPPKIIYPPWLAGFSATAAAAPGFTPRMALMGVG